jgi:hypothetical protein
MLDKQSGSIVGVADCRIHSIWKDPLLWSYRSVWMLQHQQRNYSTYLTLF